jgi:F-type H+-transporting ATPase subunit gamma
LLAFARANHAALIDQINATGDYNDEIESGIKKVVEDFKPTSSKRGVSMAGAKEIRTKIKSIKSTQKITKAMEMVAASKMRKAQERMRAARPYATKIRNVISHLAHAYTEYRSPGLVEREVKRVGLIVVSTDRGLCGGLNTNLFKTDHCRHAAMAGQGVEIDICTDRHQGVSVFPPLKGNIVAHVSHLGDAPRFEDVLGPVKVMADAFAEGRLTLSTWCITNSSTP